MNNPPSPAGVGKSAICFQMGWDAIVVMKALVVVMSEEPREVALSKHLEMGRSY